MKDKFFVLTIILALGIFLSSTLTSGATIDLTTCSPIISLVSQDPTTASPGSYVKLVFEASNLEYCSSGVAIQFETRYPFSLDAGSDSIRTLKSYPYVAGYKSTWNFAYTVRIADDASGGNYTLPFLYHAGTSTDFNSSYVEQNFDINLIDALTSFDGVIQETSGSTVSIAFANIGKYSANSVIVKIPEQDNYRASVTNGQMVGNLASGDYTIVSFDISSTNGFGGMRNPENANAQNQTSPQSSSSSNKLIVEIDYTDNIGVRRAFNLELQMPMSFTGDSTSTLRANFPGTKRSSWSIWYTVLIILGVLVVLFILYKKFPKQREKIIGKIFRKKEKHHTTSSVPEWIIKEKEREKK